MHLDELAPDIVRRVVEDYFDILRHRSTFSQNMAASGSKRIPCSRSSQREEDDATTATSARVHSWRCVTTVELGALWYKARWLTMQSMSFRQVLPFESFQLQWQAIPAALAEGKNSEKGIVALFAVIAPYTLIQVKSIRCQSLSDRFLCWGREGWYFEEPSWHSPATKVPVHAARQTLTLSMNGTALEPDKEQDPHVSSAYPENLQFCLS